MSESTLSFASSESFRKSLIVRNLQPYSGTGVYTPPSGDISYEYNQSDFSVIDSPDKLIAKNPFVNKLYPLNEFGPLGGFDFFGLDRKAIDEFNCIKTGKKFLQGDVIQLNATKSFLPYERRARKKGKSQWTFKKKFYYAVQAFFSSRKVGVFLIVLMLLLFLMIAMLFLLF